MGPIMQHDGQTASRDGAWFDAMYNNRALVPDCEQHIQRWVDQSAVARQGVGTLDLRYGPGLNETLDLFLPRSLVSAPHKTAELMPVVIFVHGGYWRALDKSAQSFIAPAFTHPHDMAHPECLVVVPNYALCPAVTIPDIVMQMVRCVAWVHDHVASYGGDSRQIILMGHSAGGQLVAQLLNCDWQSVSPHLPPTLTRKALSISGLFDLEPIMQAPFLQTDLRLTPEQVAKVSPAWQPAPSDACLYSVVGGDESAEFLRQNRLIQQVWGPHGVPVCESLAGLNHFSILSALCEPQHRLHQLAWELIQKSP